MSHLCRFKYDAERKIFLISFIYYNVAYCTLVCKVIIPSDVFSLGVFSVRLPYYKHLLNFVQQFYFTVSLNYFLSVVYSVSRYLPVCLSCCVNFSFKLQPNSMYLFLVFYKIKITVIVFTGSWFFVSETPTHRQISRAWLQQSCGNSQLSPARRKTAPAIALRVTWTIFDSVSCIVAVILMLRIGSKLLLQLETHTGLTEKKTGSKSCLLH